MFFRKCMAVLLLFFVMGIPISFAQTSPSHPAISNAPIPQDTIVPDLEITFALSINGKSAGEVNAGIWQNQAVLSKALAAQLLIEHLRPDIYSLIFDSVFKDLTWLTADDFALVGISFEFDSAQLTISITIPPEYAPVVDIDFVPEQVPNYKPILRAAPFSGFIQNDSALQVSNATSNTLNYSSQLLAMIDLKGTHLVGSGNISVSDSAFSYSVDDAYALWSDFARKLQISLGKIHIPVVGAQTQSALYGISIGTSDFEKYIVHQGFIDDMTEFTIHKLARVSVEVNGKPIRTMLLAPGNYRILDLPFTSGLNEFVLRIEESDGNVQVLRRIIPRESNILQVGTSKFALSAGTGIQDWKEFFASGYWLFGISPTFSGGFNIQADIRSAMGGLTWVSALPIGTFNGSASLVGRWDGWGEMFAPAVSANYVFSMPGNSSIPSLGLSFSYRGKGFLPPATSAPYSILPSGILSFSASLYSAIFSRTNASIGYSLNRILSSPIAMTHEIYASISQSFIQGGNLSLSGRLSFPASGSPTFSAILTFSIMPRDSYARSLNFMQTTDGATSLGILDKFAVLGHVFDFSINTSSFLPGSGESSVFNIGVRNTSEFYDVSTIGSFAHNSSLNTDTITGNLQFRTTLAFVGSHVAFTRQIPDSFILIATSPSLKKESAFYKLSSGAQYLAAKGQNIILPLTSYTTTVLSVDLVDSPLNLNPRYPFVLVSPAFRSGILFQSDVVKRYMLYGRLVDTTGKPVEYLPGDIYDLGGSMVTSTFSDEMGHFEIYDILPGTYTIEWPEGYGTTQFELSEKDKDTVDLGDIVVHSRGK